MFFYVLDTEFNTVSVLDSFESIIWTDRYAEYGDFEIYSTATQDLIDMMQHNYYLYNPDSEYMMIIEEVKIETDTEDGKHVTVSGRSLESILLRRIVWTQTIISGNLQNAIEKLLNENLISPSIADRKISNFIFQKSEDEAITSLEIEEHQYTGDDLYDVIKKLCEIHSIGFKVLLNNDHQFVFSLYSGINRSYDQNELPYVVFSPDYDNIIDSEYVHSVKDYKNVTLIAGEGEGADRRTTTIGEGTELERRELFTDARDISSEVDGGKLTDEQYMLQLTQRGKENLADFNVEKRFEGEVEATQMFVFGRDFFMGDIVQVVNEYGIESKSRVIEMIYSQSDEGIKVYPTFKILENEEEVTE